jgi:LAO/AO transport system kinase
MGKAREWSPPIVETVATSDGGTDQLVDALDRHRRFLASSDEGSLRLRRRARSYTERALTQRIRDRLALPDVEEVLDRIVARSTDPWAAAEMIGQASPP